MEPEPPLRTIVLNLLRGAVPERADEISGLWAQYGHAVEIVPSATGVTLNADAKRIRFDLKTIDVFWLLGFSAWRAIGVYAPALVVATKGGLTLDQAFDIDHDRARFEFEFRQLLTTARALIDARQTSDISWPEDVPLPTADRELLDDKEQVAAFDLALLALGFAYLHEFRHVMYCADGNGPSSLPEEEIGCDTWAREFMTSGIATYSRASGHTFSEILQKRAMGIALAAVIVHAITPAQVHWGNRQYPPMADRLTVMMGDFTLPDSSRFWDFTACMLIALMRQENRPLDFVANSSRAMVEVLLDRFR
jgi:hypothetical protein